MIDHGKDKDVQKHSRRKSHQRASEIDDPNLEASLRELLLDKSFGIRWRRIWASGLGRSCSHVDFNAVAARVRAKKSVKFNYR